MTGLRISSEFYSEYSCSCLSESKGTDFEDAIRTAVSLGGDCDTLTCIAASIGEAFFGIPEELKKETLKRIDPEMREVYENFAKAIQ